MAGFRHDEPFELPVEYHGKEHLFPASLAQMGYTYKIFVEVDGQQIVFEPDEERNLRAIVEDANSSKPISAGLIRAIGESLEKLLR